MIIGYMVFQMYEKDRYSPMKVFFDRKLAENYMHLQQKLHPGIRYHIDTIEVVK